MVIFSLFIGGINKFGAAKVKHKKENKSAATEDTNTSGCGHLHSWTQCFKSRAESADNPNISEQSQEVNQHNDVDDHHGREQSCSGTSLDSEVPSQSQEGRDNLSIDLDIKNIDTTGLTRKKSADTEDTNASCCVKLRSYTHCFKSRRERQDNHNASVRYKIV